MEAVGTGLVQLVRLAAFAALFLTPIHGFLCYRLRRARAEDRLYVAQADPWVSVVVAAAGVAAVVVVGLLS